MKLIRAISILLCVFAAVGAMADGYNWGFGNTVPVRGDYNGDGYWDLAIYDKATGNWFIRDVHNTNAPPITFGQNWGNSGMDPVSGDFNGDGVWDLAAYERATGNWFIRSLGPIGTNNPPITFGQNWGNSGMDPVSGDFNDDGVWDLAAYERATGNWFIRSLGPIGTNNPPITFGQNWGNANMDPVPGDYNGDGSWDLSVYEPSTGNWFIRSLGPIGTNNPPITFAQNWGSSDMDPVSGDFDQDGRYDLNAYERDTGAWFSRSLGSISDPPIMFAEYWGVPGYLPVPGAYTDLTKLNRAVYDPNFGNWFIEDEDDEAAWDERLTFMTFNVAASGPVRNPDYAAYINWLADYIISQSVDVLAMQEVPEDREGVNLVDLLVTALVQKGYPMWGRYRDRGGIRMTQSYLVGNNPVYIGNAVFSRFPFTDFAEYPFYAHGPGYGGPGQHLVQAPQIRLPGHRYIRAVNHHPHPALGTGTYFTEDFMSVADRYHDEETFLMGDYYFQRHESVYALLQQTYTDVYTLFMDSRLLLTSSTNIQFKVTSDGAFDFICFDADDWDLDEAFADHSVWRSDHYPVLATFDLDE